MNSVIDIAKDLVTAPLGVPTLPKELEITTNDVDQALIRYYSYLPIRDTKVYQFTDSREVNQDIAALMPDYNPAASPDTVSKYFYVGVLAFAARLQVGGNRLNEYLLGTPFVFPNAEPDKQNLLNTAYDYHIGDPAYYEDFPNNRVTWVVGASCSLSVTYALGHKEVTKLPYRHAELIAHLIGRVYYGRLLAIRKTGAFSDADFSLDNTVLEKALENAQAQSEEILGSIGLVGITTG